MIIVALIVIPCAIATVILGFMAFYDYMPDSLKFLFAIPLVIGIGTFILKRAIYEWWIARHPPRLSAKEIDILERFFPYYKRLGSEHKRKFEGRVAVFRDQKKFQMRGAGKIPGDIQLLLSATAIEMTMGFADDKEFFKNLGAVVMFPLTFITPDISAQLHAVELNQDRYDCLLVAINMFTKGLQRPADYYDCGLYGFAKAFKMEKKLRDSDLPLPAEELTARLCELRHFSPLYIFKYTGLKEHEAFEMAVEHFFHFPEQMKTELPKVYDYLVNLFHQDPLNYTSPAIQDFEEELPEEEGQAEEAEYEEES